MEESKSAVGLHSEVRFPSAANALNKNEIDMKDWLQSGCSCEVHAAEQRGQAKR